MEQQINSEDNIINTSSQISKISTNSNKNYTYEEVISTIMKSESNIYITINTFYNFRTC